MRFLASTLIITSGIAGQAVHPRDALERAVDQPTPQARHQAALELAGRKDIELSQWLELARTFGRFDRVASGVHREKVALVVGGEEEATEVFTYVPEGYDPAHPAPLLLMAHGAGGSGRGQDRQWRQIAADLGMLVLSPSEAQSTGGYSFTPRERRSAMAALRWARRRFNVDENRIYAAGVSRGGHLVWDLALRYPDQFAAIAPMIGSPRLQIDGGQNNLRYL